MKIVSASRSGIVFCCSILSFSVYAQDYQAYHKDINHAEHLFVHGKIDSALWYYDRAFAAYDFVFAKDAFIAAQVCWKNKNDTEKTGQYLMKGAANGLHTSCLSTAPALYSYLSTQDYLLLEAGLKKARLHFLQHTDTALAREWDMRFKEEQDAKNYNADRNAFSQYKEQVVRNVASIVSLWQKRRIYPGDRVTGLSNDCETMGNTDAFYSLAHYDCMSTLLDSLLWPAVRGGFLHPRDYATLWEFERLRTKGIDAAKYTNPACRSQVRSLCKFNLNWFRDKDPYSIKEVEANRREFWLCEEQTDKAIELLEQREGYKLRFNYR
ncbi:MAG: hypothetical protein JNL13_03075 [Chitinophagaceae bacterium]|nr:hypothetical protein [Chitinophagaceae bacterium]